MGRGSLDVVPFCVEGSTCDARCLRVVPFAKKNPKTIQV